MMKYKVMKEGIETVYDTFENVKNEIDKIGTPIIPIEKYQMYLLKYKKQCIEIVKFNGRHTVMWIDLIE